MAVVTAVACDPASAYYQYAGTEGGKVFRTTDAWEDGGTLVKSVADPVTAFYIDPVYNHLAYPESAIVYFGTDGGAFYKSVDGGLTFTQKTLPVSGSVQRIVADPANANKLIVGVGKYVVKSEDGGETWSTVHDFDTQVINDLAWQKLAYSQIYTAMDSDPVAQESEDEGATFSAGAGLGGVAALSAISLSPFSTGEAVALQQDSPQSWYRSSACDWQSSGSLVGDGQCLAYDLALYQILYGGTTQELDKTMDESTTWGYVKQSVNVHDISLGPLDRIPNPFVCLALTTEGHLARYDGSADSWSEVEVPVNHGHIDHHGPDFIVLPDESAVLLLDDGYQKVYRMPYAGTLQAYSEVLSGLGQDTKGGQLAFGPDPVLGGAWVVDAPSGGPHQARWSADGVTWGSPAVVIGTAGNVSVAVHAVNGRVLSPHEQVGANRLYVDDGGGWSGLASVFIYWTVADPRANRWWAIKDYHLNYSTNGGATWSLATKDNGGATRYNTRYFAIDPDGLYVYSLYRDGSPTRWRLYRSGDGGETWTDITAKLPTWGDLIAGTSMHCDSRGYLYFSFQEDSEPVVYASRNHGDSFRKLNGLATLLPGVSVLQVQGVGI